MGNDIANVIHLFSSVHGPGVVEQECHLVKIQQLGFCRGCHFGDLTIGRGCREIDSALSMAFLISELGGDTVVRRGYGHIGSQPQQEFLFRLVKRLHAYVEVVGFVHVEYLAAGTGQEVAQGVHLNNGILEVRQVVVGHLLVFRIGFLTTTVIVVIVATGSETDTYQGCKQQHRKNIISFHTYYILVSHLLRSALPL